MAGVGDVNVQFLINVPAGDPLERPCTIIGKKRNQFLFPNYPRILEREPVQR